MTYKINPEVGKILSPVFIQLPDGTRQDYANGQELADDVFDKHYNITSYEVVDGKIKIQVYEFFEPAR